jgi:toxin CcdB
MARFDYFPAGADGYLLDVQTDLITGLGTRLVIPLLRAAAVPVPVRRLHPIFEIEGAEYVMATHLMAAIAERQLGRPLGNLSRHYDEIVAAIEMVFLGF